jgi:hypothetical protein
MKNCIYISFFIISLYVETFTAVNAQSEKVDILVPNLTVKDSLFLQGLDSLIFNSVCSEIKKMNDLKIFNVYSRKNNQQDSSYRLIIALDKIVQIYNENDLSGCFDYKGYIFLWFYDVPPKLISLSNQKRKLTYVKNALQAVSSYAEFVFDYTDGILILTGICCY